MLSNRSTVREENEQTVIQIVNQQPNISRAELSQKTGLTKATISSIVNQLIESQLILETGAGSSSSVGGRKPIFLQLNKKAGISFSIDLGYNYLFSVATFLDGEIIEEIRKEVRITKENVLKEIQTVLSSFEKISPTTPYGIIGLTLAIHGIVHENTIIFAPYYNLSEMDLYAELSSKTTIPIYLENEANLSALGEKSCSFTESNLVSISIHSGIGAGIIINNQLYHGKEGRSGEIGHTILIPNGKSCPCGNKGCLEQYSSEKSILQEYNLLKKHQNLSLLDLKTNFYAHEKEAIEIIQRFSSFIAIGVNNVMASFGPDTVYLNSKLIQEIPEIVTYIGNELLSSFSKNVTLKVSSLGERSILLGATAVNLQNFFHIPSVKLDY
ncbi:MAG: ROK family transcriptional regulator [Carnobacterium sp.]|uniref:ROK family transcriptional regulator n=1 Tax=Carnobacterium sp. TaxID=48221 RepID=UPI0033160FBA